jgi:hypothetical protein
LVFGSIWLVNLAQGGEQEKKKADAEPAPAPKFVPPPPTPLLIELPHQYQRSDTRDVWQHYGVNSFGRMVPRVIRTPYGDYYSRNLDPYPWAYVRPAQWR